MEGKAHICHITTVHPADDVRIFHKECSSLQRAGYQVTLLVANGENAQINDVNIVGVEAPYSGRLGRMRKVPKVLFQKAMELNADVYHFHDPEFLRYALKMQKAGKKVIYDVHEDVPRQILAKYWIPKLVRKSVSARFERLENKISAQLSYICTATPHIRERFLKINPNTVDINNFPRLEELSDVAPYSQKSQAACYIGGMTQVRGISELVDAVADANFELHLAGKFSPESLRDQQVEKAGWKNVVEHGFLSRDGVKGVLAKSKVGVVTLHPTENYVDALPVKMFEYMAAGIPVLASNFPLWQQIVNDSQCGICVDPLNPQHIASGIEQLLADDAASEQMGLNGRKAVEEQYNWAVEEAKLKEVYANLLA